jgi:ribose 5-phosphate isomerase B
MKIAVGSDHRGHAIRAQAAKVLEHLGHEVVLFGSPEGKVEDYPDVAFAAAGMVSRGEADRAVLLAASGIGMCIAANKLPGVRAAVCIDDWMAVVSRQSFDTNVLCLSAEMFEDGQLLNLLGLWMCTEFEGGRHGRRIEKILAAERGLPA